MIKQNAIDEPKVLPLTLKKKWFDMILSGVKKEEYREQKPFWQTRFIKKGHWHSQTCKDFDVIHFTNGYGKNRPQIIIECKGIEVSNKGNSDWGFTGRCFVIKLGDVLTTINCEFPTSKNGKKY